MIRYLILLMSVLLMVNTGCRSTSQKRVNKDITGINEQLYDLEKNQIKHSTRLKKLEDELNQPRGKKPPEEKEKIDEQGEDYNLVYKDAYKYYIEKNYIEALKLLSRITARFKDDSFIDNALFLQAESYYESNQPEEALKYYQMVYRYFPFSIKADDALFKIGTMYLDSKNPTYALVAFNRLISEYPDSDFANIVSLKIRN